jgi:hypothetical protein
MVHFKGSIVRPGFNRDIYDRWNRARGLNLFNRFSLAAGTNRPSKMRTDARAAE